jgi:hypothetical protein
MTPTEAQIFFEISNIFRKQEIELREKHITETKWIIKMIIEGRKLMNK